MAYITRSRYVELYGDIDPFEFERLSFDASRLMDKMTTGIDNVKKLKTAMPTDEDDAEAVVMCCGKLISLMKAVESADGFVTREDGTVISKAVSSISSGSESMSFGGGSATSSAASDVNARNALFTDTVKAYLSGIEDANGVNLLYMGRYPNV